MEIIFDKLHTCQSDYIIFGEKINSVTRKETVRHACSRRTGIGADGAVFIKSFSESSAVIEAYNADGSFCGACESAVRVCARLLFLKKVFTGDSAVITVDGKRFDVNLLSPSFIKTQTALPSFVPSRIAPLKSDTPLINTLCEVCAGGVYLTAVYSGLPFAAIFCDNIDYINLAERGAVFQNSRLFHSGINLVFIQIVNFNTLRLRSFRYGSGEVLGCGSAALAAHATAARLGLCNKSEVNAVFEGGAMCCQISAGKAAILSDAHYIGKITVEGKE